MSRPDPNGCSRCGLATCRAHLYITHGPLVVPFNEAMGTAKQDCESRPAVDWQAECRADRTAVERVEAVLRRMEETEGWTPRALDLRAALRGDQ